MRALVLLVELLAVTAVVIGAIQSRAGELTLANVGTGAILLGAGGIHAELSLRAERMRRRIAETRYVDLSSVWTFAAALVLPACVATGVVVLLYTHLYLRVFRPSGTPPHRQVYSTSTVALAVFAVAGIRRLCDPGTSPFTSPAGLAAVALCLLAYTSINTVLVVAAIRLSQPGSRFLTILAGGEVVLELATLCLGGLGAIAIANGQPLLLAVLLPPLLLVEQSTLVNQLQERINTDAKTGLLSRRTWQERSEEALAHARMTGRTVGVLILDLDHFKQVNDRYGHLVGDAVLHAVGAAVLHELREHDLAGRFGGEEFVVTLPGLRPESASAAVEQVAERIRGHVEKLRVEAGDGAEPVTVLDRTVSVGAAVFPAAPDDLVVLLDVADAALYEAKAGGRNQIRVRSGAAGPPGARPAP